MLIAISSVAALSLLLLISDCLMSSLSTSILSLIGLTISIIISLILISNEYQSKCVVILFHPWLIYSDFLWLKIALLAYCKSIWWKFATFIAIHFLFSIFNNLFSFFKAQPLLYLIWFRGNSCTGLKLKSLKNNFSSRIYNFK